MLADGHFALQAERQTSEEGNDLIDCGQHWTGRAGPERGEGRAQTANRSNQTAGAPHSAARPRRRRELLGAMRALVPQAWTRDVGVSGGGLVQSCRVELTSYLCPFATRKPVHTLLC